MNYGTLKTDVAAAIHRADLTTQIPDFIDRTRVRIGADLRGLPNFTTGTVTSFTNGLSALPTNIAKLVAVTDSGGNPLFPMPVDIVGQYNSGVYAVVGGDLFVPEAGLTTVVTLTYYSIPDALVNAGDVSVPMLEYPQLWVYGATYEAAIYCQELELAQTYRMLFDDLIKAINRTGNESRFVAPAVVTDQVMIMSQSTL